ncbi:MAG TPA: ketopantoate reductase family protein [Vicinamibacterales bacterium]|nr:ketopantoate reductase family protein [Vicinamibacterales bacterium]
MRILILGAGAIGSVYGARLSKHHDVTLIGGAAHVEAIQRDGLTMQGLLSGVYRLPASTRVDAIAPGTLILLTAKVNNNVAAIAPIVDLLPAGVTIVCVQNGLYSENLVKELVGDRALVLRAITQVGGVLVRPGVVDNTVAGYTLLEAHEQSPAIAALLTEAGLDGRIIPDIKKEVWRKAVFNCVINPTTSLLNCEVGGIVDPRLNSLKQQIIDECLAVAAADGVTFEEDFVSLIDRVFAGARTIASMRQDLMKGRKTEIDYMNGAVADLGRKFGINCPLNDAMATMIRFLEAPG